MADAETTPTPEVTPVVTPTETPEAVAPAVVTSDVPAEVAPETPETPDAPQATMPTVSEPKDRSGMKKIARLVAELLLIAAVVGLAVWGMGLQSKNSDLQKQVDTLNSNPAVVEQKKTAELITKVAALMELPANETPQAALVSDAEALKKQYPFFTQVQNGDQVLFYVQAGKVIVYRPDTNKIVQTGPLSITK